MSEFQNAYRRGERKAAKRIRELEAALDKARKALEAISDNGGDTLTIEDAVRIADAALAAMKLPNA